MYKSCNSIPTLLNKLKTTYMKYNAKVGLLIVEFLYHILMYIRGESILLIHK